MLGLNSKKEIVCLFEISIVFVYTPPVNFFKIISRNMVILTEVGIKTKS